MRHIINGSIMLLAVLVALAGHTSNIGTIEMNLGITGLMIGMFLLMVQWIGHRNKNPTGWLYGISTLILSGILVLLVFVEATSSMWAADSGEVLPIIVCLGATGLLFYVSIPLLADSAAFIRMVAKRKEYA